MIQIYRIGRLQPSQVIPMGKILNSEGLSPAIPTYRKIIRNGKSRKREDRILQVMPGFIFLPENEAAQATAHLSHIGRRLLWMKNPTLPGTFATCTTDELRPVFEWGKAPPEQPPENEFLLTLKVGQRVRIAEGVFAGYDAVLLRGVTDNRFVTVQFETGFPVRLPIIHLERPK